MTSENIGSSYDGKEYAEELFTEEQIAKAVTELSDYSRYVDVATLNAGDGVSGEAISAFGALAKTLKLPVNNRYGTLTIRREHDAATLRRLAIDSLKR